MRTTRRVWINYQDEKRGAEEGREKLKEPVAVVGSSGLRSVGRIVVDELVAKTQPKPRLFAELFSYGFPAAYYGPSYLGAPCGVGAKLERGGLARLPSVEFYALESAGSGESDILITRGYQSYNALNQYAVADKVADFFKELGVKRVISLGAQVVEEGITDCATDLELLEEMYKYEIKRTNVDRFLGFPGLVVALAREKGIGGVCLFASTTPNLANPEYPDFRAAKELAGKVGEILGIEIDTSELEERGTAERELIEGMGKGEEREGEGEEGEGGEGEGGEGEGGEGARKRGQEREDLRGYV